MALPKPEEIIKDMEKVFSLPKIFFEIRNALADPGAIPGDLADLISHDPALSAGLLKVVNSHLFDLDSRVESIPHALSLIGKDQLLDLAMATSAVFQFRGIPNSLFNMETFWKHSVGCGLAARMIGVIRGEENVERLYLAGILHDLGRLIIYLKEPALARDAFYRSKEREENIHFSEQAILGFDHARVGGELLRSWKLSERIVDAVTYHHFPGKSEKYPVEAAIVHTADYLVHDINLAQSEEFFVPILDNKTWENIGIDPKDLAQKITEIQEQFEEVLQAYL
ncbi:MAG: HDOD domain-containing protein [Nitrospinaceae bacterium]